MDGVDNTSTSGDNPDFPFTDPITHSPGALLDPVCRRMDEGVVLRPGQCPALGAPVCFCGRFPRSPKERDRPVKRRFGSIAAAVALCLATGDPPDGRIQVNCAPGPGRRPTPTTQSRACRRSCVRLPLSALVLRFEDYPAEDGWAVAPSGMIRVFADFSRAVKNVGVGRCPRAASGARDRRPLRGLRGRGRMGTLRFRSKTGPNRPLELKCARAPSAT
jgi:hypothetical protein